MTEKEKRDNYAKRLVLRRHILSELKIPLKGNNVDEEDNGFEEYPGKYKIFIHPGEEPQVVTSETVTPLIDDLPNIKENISKKNSFQNIQKRLLPQLSESPGEENSDDNPLFSNMDNAEKHPVFSLDREETSFDILAPLPKKKTQVKQSKGRGNLRVLNIKVLFHYINRPWRWRSGLERKVRCSNPSSDRPRSLKQVVTAPLLNARQQVRVSRVLGDDHYKRMPSVVGVAR